MGYPSYLNKFFNQVKLVLAHYGIVHDDDDVAYFGRERLMATYFITSSFGRIYINVDTQMMNGTIQLDKLFSFVDNFIEYEDFSLKMPLLKKQFEAFLKDKEIFNAVVTDVFVGSNRRTYGCLLDILDVSLVLKGSAEDTDIDVGSFTIRYNKPMMWTQTRMLDKSETIPFEKNYNFNYLDGQLVYDGDYKELHQSIMTAYDLNASDLKSICFKDLAQLTLMKVY